MARGGARPGAGRPKGRLSSVTSKRVTAAANLGITPLEFLLQVLRDETEARDERMKAAIAAAPYVHPRLNAIDHSGAIRMSHEEALAELSAGIASVVAADQDGEGYNGVTH